MCQSQNGYTALIFSAQGGHLECVRLLLESGANKNAVCNVRGIIDYPFYYRTIFETASKLLCVGNPETKSHNLLPAVINFKLRNFLTTIIQSPNFSIDFHTYSHILPSVVHAARFYCVVRI